MWQLIVVFRITSDHVIEYETLEKAQSALGRAMCRAAFTGLQIRIKEVKNGAS